MEEKTQRSRRSRQERNRKLLLWVVAPACFLGIVLLRSAYQAFKIPSGSMYPALVPGDHLYISKFAYGVFETSVPARGDAIVFDFQFAPGDAKQSYIKRVIALPGDTLVVEGGHPIINGWRVPSCFVSRVKASIDPPARTELELFVEFLDDASYLVAITTDFDTGRQGPYVVPPGEVYVLGDNRNNAADSRTFKGGKGGGVPLDEITGKASILWWPSSRLGLSVHGKPMLPKLEPSPEKALAACLLKRPPSERTRPPPRRSAQ